MKALHTALWSCALIGLLALGGCQDKVDQSDMYTFTGQTAYDFVSQSDNYTDFAYLLSRVKLSPRSESTFAQLLSARGNYTCFAPTNKAIRAYLDSIYLTTGFDLAQTPDSVAEYIVRNSLIDNGEAKAFLSTDFAVGALAKTNMDDRYITIDFDTLANGALAIMVNETSRIIERDVDVSNGEVHGIDHVLELSQAMVPQLLNITPNMLIFSTLLTKTGWADSLMEYRDEDYELNHQEFGIDQNGRQAEAPPHRYIGYSIFAETDDVYLSKWPELPELDIQNGIIANWDDVIKVVQQKCQEVYKDAKSSDLTSQDNAVNQFVAYHILPERMVWKDMVIHYCEYGYGYSNPQNLSIDCFEYYETLGKNRRLLKITEGRQTKGRRLNRHAKYEYEKFNEIACDREGILVSENNGQYHNNAMNGFYYPIDDILMYDDDVPNKVLNERIRWDISSLLPELITGGYRRVNKNISIYFPRGYFKNFDLSEECRYCYLPGFATTWPDYQGDEHNVTGQYDMTLRLPPVPYEGTWEIRWAVPTFDTRGMAQLYLGPNKHNLPAINLPLDLRLSPSNPAIGCEPDGMDEEANLANDKVMRTHGYMKPPKHDCVTTGGPTYNTLRVSQGYTNYLRLRKIIYTGHIKPNDVLYLRIKSVLENTSTQFVMDWVEYAPKSVYAGTEAEDQW